MKEVICKKKSFILVLVLFLGFLPNTVLASETRIINGKEAIECQEYYNEIKDNDRLEKKYGLDLEVTAKEGTTDQYEAYLSINRDKEIAADYKKNSTKFKVTKIQFFEDENSATPIYENTNVNKTVSWAQGKNKVKLDIPEIKSKDKESRYIVYLEPDGFVDKEVVSKCGEESTFEISMEMKISGLINEYYDCDASKPGYNPKECPTLESPDGANISSKSIINCNNYEANYKDKNSFNYLFCDAKAKALAAKNDKSKDDDKVYSLKCDPEKYKYTDDYYVNKDYFFKSKTEPYTKELEYKATYTCSKGAVTIKRQQCQIKCEEAVTVEYGPPVASKAGLCFEYKVKVTSRVSCGVEGGVEKPVLEPMCTPSPVCTVPGSGVYHTQGGPNEEFDACIEACDGGKYTKKCSNKCYKKVYGSSTVKKTSGTEISFANKLGSSEEVVVEQLANGKNRQDRPYDPNRAPIHKYYCDSSGNIKWNPGVGLKKRNGSWENDSRWHVILHLGGAYGCYSPTGIPRSCTCPETCTWINGSCKNKERSYMNPGEATLDYNENVKAYKTYVAECNAAAECKSTQSTYTINIKVNKPKNEKECVEETIYYPGATTKPEGAFDELAYKGNKTTRIILSNNGCYSSNSDEKLKNIWYQAEWSFPGAWVNNKSGEISFEEVGGGTGWEKIPGKFCLPKNACDVNRKWWNYYYTKYIEENKEKTSTSDSGYTEACKEECSFKKVEKLTRKSNGDVAEVEIWNIEAIASKFGHYSWNFNIKCFYAANSNPTNIEAKNKVRVTTNCQKPECTSPNYRIRSIDLSDMFPSTDGRADNSRTPGFNWSKYATNTVKNEEYQSKPLAYASQVQTKGDSIYSDEDELDYHIELTRQKIQEIKEKLREKSDGNVSEFTGFVDGEAKKTKDTGVINYTSNFIRKDLGGVAGVDFPLESALKCNNIKGRKECDSSTVTGEGE